MNKTQLIRKILENHKTENEVEFKKMEKRIKKCVDIFFDSIKDSLTHGGKTEIRGLGSFAIKSYDGYVGRNPRTGEQVDVAPKKLPVFKQSKALKKMMNDK